MLLQSSMPPLLVPEPDPAFAAWEDQIAEEELLAAEDEDFLSAITAIAEYLFGPNA